MFVAPNCDCGGGPEIMVMRGERVFDFELDFGDRVQAKKGDVIFVSCAVCGAPLELKEIIEARAAGHK